MALTEKLKAIADAIRGKTGKADEMTLDQMPTEIEGIQSGGGTNWLEYVTSLNNAFEYVTAMPDSVDMYLPQCTTIYATFAFRSDIKNLTEIKLDFGESKPTDIGAAFCASNAYVQKVTIVGDLSAVTSYWQTFSNRVADWRHCLIEVDADLDFTSATSVKEMFRYAAKLEKVRFVPNTLSLSFSFGWQDALTAESLVSIANGLNASTTGQTLTLTTGTQEQISAIMGNNSDGTFVQDDAGAMTLTEFITTVKGWTIA